MVNKTRIIFFGFLILLVFSFELPALFAQDFNWWNDDWNKAKEIVLNENTGVSLEDYSLLLIIYYDGDMNLDFSDLRFVDSMNNEINYWIEEKVDGTYAKIWINIPNIYSEIDNYFYMYYGNSIAPAVSNFNNAFLYADDFERDTLDNYVAFGACNNIWISEGNLKFDYILGPCTISPNLEHQLIAKDYIVEGKMLAEDGCIYTGVIGYMPTFYSKEGGYSSWFQPNLNKFGVHDWLINGWIDSIIFPISDNVYYESEMIFSGDEDKTAVFDNLRIVSIKDLRYTQGYYGLSSYEGCNRLSQTNVDWFRVRPYVKVIPTYEIGEEVDGNSTPFPDDLTQRVEELEINIEILVQAVNSLEEEISKLNVEQEKQEDKLQVLETMILDLQTFVDKIFDYFNFLSINEKEEILCNYLDENQESSIEDLGMHCYIEIRGKKEKCFCEVI